jgi:uncharacterized protein YndB with AHSA1/START domain
MHHPSGSSALTPTQLPHRYLLSDDDGNEYGFHGSFHEVRPSEVIVQTFTFEGVPDSVALERLQLEDLATAAAG